MNDTGMDVLTCLVVGVCVTLIVWMIYSVIQYKIYEKNEEKTKILKEWKVEVRKDGKPIIGSVQFSKKQTEEAAKVYRQQYPDCEVIVEENNK